MAVCRSLLLLGFGLRLDVCTEEVVHWSLVRTALPELYRTRLPAHEHMQTRAIW